MFKIIIFSLLLTSVGTWLHAQCVEGNCENGTGKYDYSYAVYTGEFTNSQPHGKGIMDYGKGEKYDGEFKNGKEDGKGLYIKDGQIKGVVYKEGVLIKKDEVIAVGARPQMEGCKSGDCENGFGAALFESGNKYEGNFKNFRFHGKGKMTFATGNIIEADFNDNTPVSGTFTYKNEKTIFTGSFNSDGSPNTGTYSYPENESTVTVKDNVIVKVDNPKAEAARKKLEEEINRKPATCPQCQGKKVTSSTTSHSYTTPGTFYMSSNFHRMTVTEPRTVTSKGRTFYNVCTKCGGKGVL